MSIYMQVDQNQLLIELINQIHELNGKIDRLERALESGEVSDCGFGDIIVALNSNECMSDYYVNSTIECLPPADVLKSSDCRAIVSIIENGTDGYYIEDSVENYISKIYEGGKR